jgi:site-specific recombinase XerC
MTHLLLHKTPNSVSSEPGAAHTGNLRAVQLLLGHTKIESTVRYLGIEVDDALAIAEQVDV